MYREVIEEMPAGLPGQLSRFNGAENIMPFRAEGNDCQAGVFAFDGTKLGESVVAITTTAGAKPIGVIMRTPFRTNTGAKSLNHYLEGMDIQVVNSCYVYVIPTNSAKWRDKVFVKPATGEIQTSPNETLEGFVDTGFRVFKAYEVKCVVEITDKNF